MLDPAIQPYYQRLTQNPDDAEALYVLWQWFGDRGQFQQLAQIAEQVAERRLDPTSAADLFFRAGQLWAVNLRRPDRAAPNYRKAYERDPNNIEAIVAARELYLAADNFKNAAMLYEKELAVTADEARRLELVRGLAEARGRLNDPAGQAAALEEVIRLQPDDFQAMHQLAEAYRARASGPGGGQEDQMRAATLYSTIAHSLGGEHLIPYSEAALDCWPGDEIAFTTLRDHHARMGTLADIATRQLAFLEANPTSEHIGRVRRDLATLYASYGQYDDAIAALAPLVEFDASASRELADLYGLAGRIEERVAIIASLPAAEDPAQRLHDLREMAAIFGQQNDRGRMIDALREILRAEPTDPEALSIVDEELRINGAYGELRQVLYAASRSSHATAETKRVWIRDIAIFSEQKMADVAGAIEAWRTILASSPSDSEAGEALERLFEQEARWDDLARWIEKRASRETNADERRRMYLRLADLQRDQRMDPSGEADALHAIWHDDPSDDEIASRLAAARKRAGDDVAASEVLRHRAEAATPELAIERYTELAEHLTAMDALDEALQAWQQIVSLDPGHAGAWEAIESLLERTSRHDMLLDTLIAHAEGPAAGSNPARLLARAAEIARLLGDVNAAISQAERALALEPNDEATAVLLGEALEAHGDEERLLQHLRDRVGRAPDGEAKIETLRRLGRALSRTDQKGAMQSWDELREVSQRVLAKDDVEALAALAGFAELSGDDERLASLLQEAANAAGDDVAQRREFLTRRADLLEHSLGRASEALEVLRTTAHEVEPSYAPVWALLAAAAQRHGQPSLVAEALEAQINLTSDDEQRARIAASLADLYETQLNDMQRCIHALELQYDADPTDYALVERLVRLCEAEQRWDEVLRYLTVLSEVEGDEEALSTLFLRMADVAEHRLGDAKKAFAILSDAAKNGDENALQAARSVADGNGLARDLVPLLDELSQGCTGAARAALCLELSNRTESGLKDLRRALDYALRAVIAAPTDDVMLDRFDSMATQLKGVEQTMQAYGAATAGRDSASDVASVAVRGARVLESIGAVSKAFELVLAAQGRAPAEDVLLDELERLAPAAGKGDELFIAFDRRRNGTKDEAAKFELLLRAAKAALVGLDDLQTASDYLRHALSQAISGKTLDPNKLTKIADAARGADRIKPAANMRSTLVELLAEQARERDEDDPKLAANLHRVAGDLCAIDLALPDHAWMLYSRSMMLWPADGHIADAMESYCEQFNRLPQLAELYIKVVDEAYEPETARAYQARRAKILADKLGQVDEAIEALRTLVEIAPKDREALHALQDLLHRHDRFQDLLMALERELELNGTDRAQVYRSIARVWDQSLKNVFEAKDAWKRVLKAVPGDQEATEALARLEKKRRVADDDGDDLEVDSAQVDAPSNGPAAGPPPLARSSSLPPPPRMGLGKVQTPSVAQVIASVAKDEPEEIDASDVMDGTSSKIVAPPPDHDDELDDDEFSSISTGDIQLPPPELEDGELAAESAQPSEAHSQSDESHAANVEPEPAGEFAADHPAEAQEQEDQRAMASEGADEEYHTNAIQSSDDVASRVDAERDEPGPSSAEQSPLDEDEYATTVAAAEGAPTESFNEAMDESGDLETTPAGSVDAMSVGTGEIEAAEPITGDFELQDHNAQVPISAEESAEHAFAELSASDGVSDDSAVFADEPTDVPAKSKAPPPPSMRPAPPQDLDDDEFSLDALAQRAVRAPSAPSMPPAPPGFKPPPLPPRKP
jgi:hypothetical protein